MVSIPSTGHPFTRVSTCHPTHKRARAVLSIPKHLRLFLTAMRLALLGSLALFVAAAAALPVVETNAQRLARGLPPLPPVARALEERKDHRESLLMISYGILG